MLKIMLVDDDTEILDQMAKFLSKRDYDVVKASSGEKALEENEESSFDIVVTDLKMPKITGMDVLKAIKKKRPETYVVILTGYGTIDSAVDAMKAGAFDYLTKPFKMKELIGKIDDIKKEVKLKSDMKKVRLIEEFRGVDYIDFLKTHNIDRPLLLMTVENPEGFVEELEIEEPEMVWLTNEETPLGIPPKKLVLLKDKMKIFSNNQDSGIIFIQGLESLIDIHGWKNIKRFLFFISNEVLKDDFQLILTVKPETLDSAVMREVAGLMSRDFVKAVGDSLSNKARVGIVTILDRREDLSFTKIKKALNVVNSSALAFHLKKLLREDFIYIDKEKKYRLTKKGEKFSELIKSIEDVSITDIGGKFLVLMDEPE